MIDSATAKNIAFYTGPAIGGLLGLFLHLNGWGNPAAITAGITALCAIWWIFEPIPVPATSLIPIGFFPLLGVLDKHQIAASYGSPLIILLMGGFILSKAMEKSGAHRRIALGMVNLFGGGSAKRLVFGFMAASATLSMWISNTATTLMLLPVALAVLEKTDNKQLTVTLLLGIAYAASLGGIGTPIGTPPNIIFMTVYEENIGSSIDFIQWMSWGVPTVLIFLPLMAYWLTRNLTTTEQLSIPPQGAWRSEEKRVLIIFTMTALAWMTIKTPFGGWAGFFDISTANHAAVAICAAVILFITPNGQGEKLLDWKTASTIPWGVLLLFAGGIAIAKAFIATGLSTALGEMLSALSSWNIILLILTICLVVTFLTEMTSNTATTTLLMPILAAAAIGANIDPVLLMVPAAMSASCAFMLPVATAPNAVVFGTEKIAIQKMIREGFALNMIGALVITGVCFIAFGD